MSVARVVVAVTLLLCFGCQRATRAACALDDTTSVSTRIAAAWHSFTGDDPGARAHGCVPEGRI